jgi:hypothetical protein
MIWLRRRLTLPRSRRSGAGSYGGPGSRHCGIRDCDVHRPGLRHTRGSATDGGGKGGPEYLSEQPYHIGINDVLGADPSGAAFNPVVFNAYEGWANATGPNAAARQAVARGETLFNTLPITITGVAGLNDLPGLSTVNGTCTTCHDTPNAGNHSVSLAIKIGTTDYRRCRLLNISGLPVYTVACADGSSLKVTDIGRAMITGSAQTLGS